MVRRERPCDVLLLVVSRINYCLIITVLLKLVVPFTHSHFKFGFFHSPMVVSPREISLSIRSMIPAYSSGSTALVLTPFDNCKKYDAIHKILERDSQVELPLYSASSPFNPRRRDAYVANSAMQFNDQIIGSVKSSFLSFM